MQTPESIKARLTELCRTNPNIHVSVSIVHPRVSIQNDPAVLLGTYRNVFRIEERSTGQPRCHTLQYVDVLTGQIRIAELEQ